MKEENVYSGAMFVLQYLHKECYATQHIINFFSRVPQLKLVSIFNPNDAVYFSSFFSRLFLKWFIFAVSLVTRALCKQHATCMCFLLEIFSKLNFAQVNSFVSAELEIKNNIIGILKSDFLYSKTSAMQNIKLTFLFRDRMIFACEMCLVSLIFALYLFILKLLKF